MRIRVLIPQALDVDGRTARAALCPAGTVGSDVDLEWAALRVARPSGDELDETRLAVAVADAGAPAEEEGLDALVIDSVADPGLYALRSRLSIPVVGAGLAAYSLAVNLGRRFSIILTTREVRHAVERALALYELADRCSSIRLAATDPNSLVSEAGSAVGDDGADVVIVGSTVLSSEVAAVAEQLPCPLIDPGLVSLQTAERLVRLDLAHSKAAFPTPHVLQDEKLSALLDP